MKKLLPFLLFPSAALAHSGHDIAPTPQGMTHALSYADHLTAILGAAGLALIVVAGVAVLRRLHRDTSDEDQS